MAAEWLEADGLGGFACGTVSGIRTRRYHALLLSATTPPTGRMVLANGFDAGVVTSAGGFALSSQRYTPDVIHPEGLHRIVSFEAEPWPRWVYTLDDGTRIAQELFIPHEHRAVCLTWRLLEPMPSVTLLVRPFFSGRDYHSLHHENPNFAFEPQVVQGRLIWQPYPGIPSITAMSNGTYTYEPDWYRNFLYEEEAARGLDCTEDLASPGVFRWNLSQGEAVWILTTDQVEAEVEAERLVKEWRNAEETRRRQFPSRLHRAGDAYLVRRGDGQTIVAGYPWFTDWGRDTFIALRGLCLATGRLDDARAILLQWAGAVSEGMLPNLFTDHGETPEFNSVDASLWYVIAVHEYLEATKGARGAAALEERARLQAAVQAILDGYSKGTRFGIRCDGDGLLAAGIPGVQLTWMDAKVGDWVVTPRIGKPVEVQALWLNALRIGSQVSPRWLAVFERGLESFRSRFWNAAARCLYDVVDADHQAGKVDVSVRPNQIFAVGGLPFPLLDGERARTVVEAVEERLWTPIGLRSLAPGEPGYRPRYEGGVRQRDSAYHQGTVWPWLLGPFVEAWVRVRDSTREAKAEARARFLDPLLRHLDEAGLGHVSEIADADPPHTPRGCPFQAWSVGEALRLTQVVLADNINARGSKSGTDDTKTKKRRPAHARG
jgi:predicted glycogen debranching enzyme